MKTEDSNRIRFVNGMTKAQSDRLMHLKLDVQRFEQAFNYELKQSGSNMLKLECLKVDRRRAIETLQKEERLYER